MSISQKDRLAYETTPEMWDKPMYMVFRRLVSFYTNDRDEALQVAQASVGFASVWVWDVLRKQWMKIA